MLQSELIDLVRVSCKSSQPISIQYYRVFKLKHIGYVCRTGTGTGTITCCALFAENCLRSIGISHSPSRDLHLAEYEEAAARYKKCLRPHFGANGHSRRGVQTSLDIREYVAFDTDWKNATRRPICDLGHFDMEWLVG